MPTDYKGKIIHNMSQTKFNELLESNGGKLPAEFANSIVHTRAEDVNLSQLRTKVLWTNPNPNIAFEAHNITLSDGNYEYLEVILRATTRINRQYSVKIKKGSGANLLTYYSVDWSPYNYDQFRTADYISDTEYSISENYRRSTDKSDIGVSNDQNIPIEIIGYYKTPAMIYTGAELHEGYGVSIENGVISAKSLIKLNAEARWSSAQSTTEILTLKSYTINKTYNDSALHINYTCPISNNSNGYGSFLAVKIDGVEKGPRVLSNFSGFFTLNHLVQDIDSGNHTIEFCIGNGGSGTTSIPAYEQMTASVAEVL